MKTLAQQFAEKYNSMTKDEQTFEFGLNHTFNPGRDFNGFKFKDGSRFEFNDDKSSESVKWFVK